MYAFVDRPTDVGCEIPIAFCDFLTNASTFTYIFVRILDSTIKQIKKEKRKKAKAITIDRRYLLLYVRVYVNGFTYCAGCVQLYDM